MHLEQELAQENKIKPYKKGYFTLFDHINTWQENYSEKKLEFHY